MVHFVPTVHVVDGLVARRDGMRWVPGGFPSWLPSGDAEKAARRLFSLFGEIAIVDVDGLEGGDPDLELLSRLSRSGVAFWSDAGPRSAGDFVDLSFVGASSAVVRAGWMAPHDVEEALEVTDIPLYLGVAAPRDLPLLPRYERVLGSVTGLLVVSERAEGLGGGFPVDLLPGLPAVERLYVAGGVATPDEARSLGSRGAHGILVGTALLPRPEEWREFAAGGTLAPPVRDVEEEAAPEGSGGDPDG